MKRTLAAVLLCLVTVGICSSATSSVNDMKKGNPEPEPTLLGTWKLAKAIYGGKEAVMPEGHVEYKHVTPVQFTLVSIDKGTIIAAFGGPYTVKGDKYEETPEYGFTELFTNIKGKPQTFTWKIEGNKWYHRGTLTGGFVIEEVWERVDKQ